MGTSVIVWDIETVPDLKGFAAANGHDVSSEDDVRAAMGDKFPKHIYHSIICIGALVAHQGNDRWTVSALGAPHIGERSEKELLSSFVGRIAELTPQLVTFNGSSFDLPVLRYRAMVHGIAAPGLSLRPYFNRYTNDAVDRRRGPRHHGKQNSKSSKADGSKRVEGFEQSRKICSGGIREK
jgi:3'-5' exonuclease